MSTHIYENAIDSFEDCNIEKVKNCVRRRLDVQREEKVIEDYATR